jgi:hypothetical protein
MLMGGSRLLRQTHVTRTCQPHGLDNRWFQVEHVFELEFDTGEGDDSAGSGVSL